MSKEFSMNRDFPFIALCSSILNTKSTRNKFTNPVKQKELLKSLQLNRNQVKALRAMDIDAIADEIKKEIKKAAKGSSKDSRVSVGW